MTQQQTPVLPTEAFDAIFRSESLEERIEFQTCGIYENDVCTPGGGDPGNGGGPPVTTTPEPATIGLAATGLGGVGVVSYLRRRAARRQDSAQPSSRADAPRE